MNGPQTTAQSTGQPTAHEPWLAAATTQLADALAEVRTALERLATADDAGRTETVPRGAGPTGPEAARTGLHVAVAEPRRGLFRRREAGTAPGTVSGPAPAAGTLPGTLPAATPAAHATGQDLPLDALCRALGLTDFERRTMLLCTAMELDTRTAGLCARAQHDDTRPFPSFGLALGTFDDPAWDALSPDRPLRYWQLVNVDDDPGTPLVNRRLTVDERIVNFLKGLVHLDVRLAPLLVELVAAGSGLPGSQLAVAESVAAAVMRARGEAGQLVVQLLGRDTSSKELVAAHAARALGLRLFKAGADALPTTAPALETATRLWRRETLLAPVCLYLDATELDPADPDAAVVRQWLGRGGGLVFLGTRDRWPRAGTLSFEAARPTTAEQRQAWMAGIGGGDLPARLAGQFDFSLATIGDLAQSADAADASGDGRRLWAAALARARPALDRLAERIDAKATWDDLQLPAEQTALLHQIAGQVAARGTVYGDYGFAERMNRGLGISVLFTGESGTGKTMAAEVLANDLGLLLYRVDLSAVVSKYIGETEKNLRRLFDAAEDGGAILFFDEADALFGKRSEVKDSHDRYANIEINYLLQRVEAFRGLAVLATNRKDSLDQAFLRRLRFIVTFPFPAPAQRRAMWERAFPAATKVTGLDHERLARLNVTGGSIANIALNAAFLAAGADGTDRGTVTMPLVLAAARNEFRKLDKPLGEAGLSLPVEPVGEGAGHGV
ncbi:ATP-binding protein [Specibacter cremeus]|uniref:ATP-binding protein n=1 Tax=Specibacter cremeus TaxID=1629051 RepID=UPI001F0C2570|nr:ATP-binding protein [Specibacter cremeus]